MNTITHFSSLNSTNKYNQQIKQPKKDNQSTSIATSKIYKYAGLSIIALGLMYAGHKYFKKFLSLSTETKKIQQHKKHIIPAARSHKNSSNSKSKNDLTNIQNLILGNIQKIKTNKNWNPNELDKILTEYVGEHNVKELTFYPNEEQKVVEGRIKSYTTPSKNIFILESHVTKDGITTRLYLANSKKNVLHKKARFYLTREYIFKQNQYDEKCAHLPSDTTALSWIKHQ